MKEKDRKENSNIFILTGISIIISATIFIYFLGSLVRNDYLIHYAIDSIIGIISLIFMVKNLITKHKMIKKYTKKKFFIAMDILSILLSLMIKIFIPIAFDFTLVILLISYFVSKKSFDQLLASK